VFHAGVKAVCNEYKIHNADITMRDDCDIDDLVDVIEGSRVYIPCIYAVNKIVRSQPLLPFHASNAVCQWVCC
jgi:ribosome-interacting GTPase 1